MIQDRFTQFRNNIRDHQYISAESLKTARVNSYDELIKEPIFLELREILIQHSDYFEASSNKIESYLVDVDFYSISICILLEEKANESILLFEQIVGSSWYNSWNAFQKCIFLKLYCVLIRNYGKVNPGSRPNTNQTLFSKKCQIESDQIATNLFLKFGSNHFSELGWYIIKEYAQELKHASKQFSFLNQIENQYKLKDIELLLLQNTHQNRMDLSQDSCKEIFFQDTIEIFYEIEERLINERYLNEKLEWQKTIDECAAFINKLIVNDYFKHKKKGFEIWITKTVKPFFEKRYGIHFTIQLQNKYRNSTKLSPYFTWITKAE